MIIRQIVPSLARKHGGPSRSVRALARAQAAAGHDVRLLATDPQAPAAGESSLDGTLAVEIHRRDWPGRLCRSGGLRRSLGSDRPEVVHHHALWLRTLHYAHLAARASGAPLVVSPRGMMGPWAWRHHRWRKAWAALFLHPGALTAVDGWHATSEQEARDIAALGFTQPACVAPNGIEPPTAEEHAAALAHWKPRLLGHNPRRVALFHSRFHRKKRIMELLDLWAATAPPDWHLLVVGIPDEYAADYVERRIASLGLGNRASVHDGTRAPAPYAAASIFLLPSRDENFGLSIAEAMAWRVPVVVTDRTPWREVQTRGIGWCVSWEEYPAALRASLASAEAELSARGDAARDWILGNFSWASSASRLMRFYEELRRAPAGGRSGSNS